MLKKNELVIPLKKNQSKIYRRIDYIFSDAAVLLRQNTIFTQNYLNICTAVLRYVSLKLKDPFYYLLICL